VVERITGGIAYGVTFKVNEAGRQRVLRERRKNVHSFVVAERLEPLTTTGIAELEVRYNPYVSGCFTVAGNPIHQATAVLFTEGRCYLLQP
jgi:hypothetical protein